MKKNDITFILGGIFWLGVAILAICKGVVDNADMIITTCIFILLGIGFIFAGFKK